MDKFPCPCCGHLTLGERGGFEICSVCFWQDDGQDDPHADEYWGGPNRVSLTQGRLNYLTLGAAEAKDMEHVRLPAPDEPRVRWFKLDQGRAAEHLSLPIDELGFLPVAGTSTETSLDRVVSQFGLRSSPTIYRQVDWAKAKAVLTSCFHRDLAYGVELLPEERALLLAQAFLDYFPVESSYYTNGTYYEPSSKVGGVGAGPSWSPATHATFDTGIVVIGPTLSGVLWVTAED